MNIQQKILKLLQDQPMNRLTIVKFIPEELPQVVSQNINALLMTDKITSDGHDFSIAKKKNKHNNVITEYDGIKFRSKKEMERYCELQILIKAGEITDLQTQVKFEVAPAVPWNGRKIKPINYYADFVYMDKQTGKKVIEDCKGQRLPLYLLKRSHVILNNPDCWFKES